jgi:uncharacterized repeat protein (TIGR03803 family)
VALDNAGNLYGTTNQGGNPQCMCGTVFELTASGAGRWTETVLHSFSAFNGDGTNPDHAGLLLNKSGAMAGTTLGGGVYQDGTVFGLLPPSGQGGKWEYKVLYSFGASETDGEEPEAG